MILYYSNYTDTSCAAGYSQSPSSSITAATSAPPRGYVASLRAVSVTQNSVLLSWSYVGATEVNRVTRYKVEASHSNFTAHKPTSAALDGDGNEYITVLNLLALPICTFVLYSTKVQILNPKALLGRGTGAVRR